MKKKQFNLKYLVFLLLGITVGSGNAWGAYNILYSWDFLDASKFPNRSDHQNDWDLYSNSGVYFFNGGDVNNNRILYWNLSDDLWFPCIKSKQDPSKVIVFNTTDHGLGFRNEPTDNTVEARCMAIKKGSSITIPATTGQHVIIRMGRYGSTSNTDGSTRLTITNATDAMGKTITSDYRIGGTRKHDNKNEFQGQYIFTSTSDAGITITLVSGAILKLYTIEIYEGSFYTYNGILSTDNNYGFFTTDKSTTGVTSTFNLHHWGSHERQQLEVLGCTGNLNVTSEDFTPNGNYTGYSFTSNKGDFGTVQLRMKCMTYADENNYGDYCTDYSIRTFTIGYRETMEYPYTWDFTDVKGYAENDDCLNKETDSNYGDLKLWNKNGDKYSLNLSIPINENTAGVGTSTLICGGTQLYAGSKMIRETAGLGINVTNTGDVYNGTLQITSEGLKMANPSEEQGAEGMGLRREWWTNSILIPDVPANAAIYVRASRDMSVKDEPIHFYPYTSKMTNPKYEDGVVGTPGIDDITATFLRYNYKIGSGAETQFGSDGNSKYFDATDDSGDKIMALKVTSSSKSDVILYLNGYIVKKIAVSSDFKTVNDLGYASESRDHEIDPELMGYMTGTGLKAYTVTNVNYGDKAGDVPSITLSPVDKAYVIGAATTGDHNAYIIYNTDVAKEGSKAVKAINNGFHLFVPDMHDKSEAKEKKSKLDVSRNSLVSWLASGKVPQTEDVYTNYLMNSKGYNEITGEQVEGEEAFYRASKSNSLGANKAYLQLLTEKVKPNNGKPATAKMAIIFVDEESGTQTTSIDGIDSREDILGNNDYYTLSGIKVNAPAKGGIYIKNGKKVIVK